MDGRNKFDELVKQKEKEDFPKNTETRQDELRKFKALAESKAKVDNIMLRFGKGFLRLLPIVGFNLLSLFIIGLDNFLETKWDWNIFLTEEFWYSYISYQTANWIIAITFLITAIKQIKKWHKQYHINVDKIQGMVNIDHDEHYLNLQVDIEALERKRESFEAYVSEKIYKMIRRYAYIKTVKEFLDKPKESYDSWNKKRVWVKLSKLNDMLTFEWQKKYLKSFKSRKVQYPEVSRQLLTSGFSAKNKNGKHNTYKPNTISTSLKTILPSTIVVSVLAVILLAIQFSKKSWSWASMAKFIIQIVLIYFNTIMVVSNALTIFESTQLRSSEERSNDLDDMYKKHKNKNKGQEQILEIIYYNLIEVNNNKQKTDIEEPLFDFEDEQEQKVEIPNVAVVE